MFSSSFLSPSTGNSLDLYDEADDSYATSDADLFSEATTILDELDDIDELGAMSPDSYLASDADVEAANMESFLENSSEKGTMNDDDDDMAIPKGKSIAHHLMPINMVYASFDVETGGLRNYSGKNISKILKRSSDIWSLQDAISIDRHQLSII